MKNTISNTLRTAKKSETTDSSLFHKNFYSIKKTNNMVFAEDSLSKSKDKALKAKNKSPLMDKSETNPKKLKINQSNIVNNPGLRSIEKSLNQLKSKKNNTPLHDKQRVYNKDDKYNLVDSKTKIESSPNKLKDIKDYIRAKSSENKKEPGNKIKPEIRKSIPKPEPYPAEATKRYEFRKKSKNSLSKQTKMEFRQSSRNIININKNSVTPPKTKTDKNITTSLSRSRKYLSNSQNNIDDLTLSKNLKGTLKDYNNKTRTPRDDNSRSSISRKSISPNRINKKVIERSQVAQSSFKLNLQDLIHTDELYMLILNSKPSQKNSFTFDLLRQYLIYNYCFLIKDLNVLFTNTIFREKMRKNYLKELNFFIYLLMLLIELQVEKSLSNQDVMFQNNKLSYNLALAAEIYELIVQIISHLHITFILRAEIFLDRAAVYYQNHAIFKQLKLLLSRRKSNYNITFSKNNGNYEEYLLKIERYLELTEQAMHELFKLNKNFLPLSFSLFDNLVIINQRKGEITINEINKYFQSLNISFDNKGISNFDIEHMSSLLTYGGEKDLSSELEHDLPKPPFIKKPRNKDKKLTLVMDLDETLIHYPDDKLSCFENSAHQHILVRPFTTKFLTEIAEYFEIIIFTAASQNYADRLIDIIDENRVINYRLYRQHMTMHNNVLVKDISKIGRDLKKIIILDNTPENFVLQPDNGVYVKSWRGDLNDKVFLLLLPVFNNLANLDPDDIREVLIELKHMLIGGGPDK